MTPSLFDAAAERAAIESGRPLSQELAEIVAPTPDPLPAGGLFAPPEASPYSALLAHTHGGDIASILSTIERFGEPIARYLARHNVSIHALGDGVRYDAASPELARLRINVDAWPVPPAGLFVVAERTLYLRDRSPLTVAHEYGHAIDCALGGGVYRSGLDPDIRAAFAAAPRFVTPYAATGIDEYFAESVRAWFGINNSASGWPKVTRERLLRCDQRMHAILGAIFEGELSA